MAGDRPAMTSGVEEEVGRRLLTQLPLSMVVTDPNLEDNPIVYVNRAFEALTGYDSAAAVGRNCRFLQGKDTDQPEVAELARGVAEGRAVMVDLRNYRADGTPFVNRLMITPVRDEADAVFAFVGIQHAVGSEDDVRAAAAQGDALRELQHRVKNHLQMIASMIRMEGRNEDAGVIGMMSRRVETLSLLYDEFNHGDAAGLGARDVISAGAYISRVASTVGALDGRASVRLNIDVDELRMRADRAAKLGLVLSEVLSNTLEHAFRGRADGTVAVRLEALGGDRARLSVSDDGVGLGTVDWPASGGSGARIVTALARDLGGEIGVTSTRGGTIVTLDLVE